MNTHDWSNKTVMIVEDDQCNCLLLEEILKPTGVNIICASNGKEAVEECEENDNIELILMDIKMPVMCGLEAVEKIKKMRATIPVIAQTAYAFDRDKSMAMEKGFDDYLIKPLKEKDVIKAIEKFFLN